MEKVIEVRKLHRTYIVKRGFWKRSIERIEALRGITFNVYKGEVFGILGPNGAGKTTTIKILTTLLLPTSGEAKVLGYDVAKEAEKIRPKINFVMGGERNLYQRLSAIENLEYFADLYGVPLRRREKIYHLLNLVKIPPNRFADKVETFSKGMKQRLQIARALINDPEVLFLDEPTIGLDPVGAKDLRTIIKILKKLGKTIILTTHYMQEADELCDRIALLKNGKILRIETPEGLKKQHTDKFEIKILMRDCIDKSEIEVLIKKFKKMSKVFNVDQKHSNDGIEIMIYTEPSPEALIQVFESLRKVQINDISLRKSSLEDVYIKLLGEGGS